MKKVLHMNYANERGVVFCRKRNMAVILSNAPCHRCELFEGHLQGEGIECLWEDEGVEDIVDVWDVRFERERVKELIHQKILQKL